MGCQAFLGVEWSLESFFLTPHLEETTKKNRGKFLPSNFRRIKKFDECSFAKKKPSANEVKEEEEKEEEEEEE